jgi:hypothetical protein
LEAPTTSKLSPCSNHFTITFSHSIWLQIGDFLRPSPTTQSKSTDIQWVTLSNYIIFAALRPCPASLVFLYSHIYIYYGLNKLVRHFRES